MSRFIFIACLVVLLGVVFSIEALQSQQQVVPTRELKVGARNSTIRNIGSFQADSALIFPKRQARSDTAKSVALRKKGAFFYDSSEHVVWFYDGTRFRTISSDSNIYTKSDSIKEQRVVTLKKSSGGPSTILKFVEGRIVIDTLFLPKLKDVTNNDKSWDSVLVINHDTVYKKHWVASGGINIYNTDSTLKGERKVTMAGRSLKFDGGDVHVDTLFIHKPIKGTSTDSFLVKFKDTVRYIPYDSLWNIYTKDDSIREVRTVTIKASTGAQSKDVALKFVQGRVEIDTLLVRKRRLGLSTDTFMVVHNDTVRRIPRDSLWNIYTKDDSLRNTKDSGGRRTVWLQAKKLLFALGNSRDTSANDTAKVGIGQQSPLYTLDIATNTALRELKASSSPGNTSKNPAYDTIAVRIAHHVTEEGTGAGEQRTHTSYGLVIAENSNKAFGRSAIGFQNLGKGTGNRPFMKARLWTQLGRSGTQSKFGIDVANNQKQLHTRMVIDSIGRIGFGVENPTERLHIRNATSATDNNAYANLIRIEAPGTGGMGTNSQQRDHISGLWMTENNNNYGWIFLFNANNHKKPDDKEHSGQISPGNYLSINYTQYGVYGDDYIKAINRTDGSVRNSTSTKTDSYPAMRVSSKSTDKNQTVVIISPIEGVGNGSDAFRVHGKSMGQQWATFSDSILKRDIHVIAGFSARDIINRLRPVTYHMRGDSSVKLGLNYGFIAQEVEKVMPDIVQNSRFRMFADQPKSMPDSIKSINYDAIIAPLVSNVQLLNQENLQQNTRFSQLEQQISELKASRDAWQNLAEAQHQRLNLLEAEMEKLRTAIQKLSKAELKASVAHSLE